MSFRSLRQKSLTGILMCLLMFALNGCIYLVVGSVGALGGYVISPDTVEGMITNQEFLDVWDAVYETISVMGVIEEQSEAGGMIIADVQGVRVTVSVVQLGESTIKLNVKARKAFLPKIKVAQDVYIKIERYLIG